MILPISIIVVVFLFAGFAIFLKSKEKKREMELRAELIAKALEQGRELPPELFQEKKQISKSLKTGILLSCISIGIIIFMAIAAPEGYRWNGIAGGLLSLFVGIAFLIIYLVSKKQGVGDGED